MEENVFVERGHPTLFFFFFWQVIRFTDIKNGSPSTGEAYSGQTNQVQKWHGSRKEENDWFHKANSQSTKVLKKNNLRSDMDLSLSSKHLLFLSLQRLTLDNGGQLSIYDHSNDGQSTLANKLGVPQLTLA